MTVRWLPLGEVLTSGRDSVEIDPTRVYRKVGVRGFGRGVFEYEPMLGTDLGKLRFFALPPNRLVVSNIKGWEGAIAVTAPSEAGRIVSNRFLLYSSEQMSLHYVAHWLLSSRGLLALQAASPGSADRNRTLSADRFEAIRVPVVPRREQDRIAVHLDSLARASESSRRVAAQTDAKQGRLINQLVSGASRNADHLPVGKLLVRDRGWIEIDSAVAYSPVGIRGFGRGMIRYSATAGSELSRLRYYRLVPGSLLVSNIKAWEGAVCVVEPSDVERIASNRFLQHRSLIDPFVVGWLHRYFLTPAGVAQLAGASPGSADRNRTLSMDSFEALEVPLPKLELRQTVIHAAAISDRIAAAEARRDRFSAALLPAARNEIFAAMA